MSDLLTDLTSHRKELGRKLRGKKVFIITPSVGNGIEEFESALYKTFHYLSMDYKGCFFYYTGENEKERSFNTKKTLDIEQKIFK